MACARRRACVRRQPERECIVRSTTVDQVTQAFSIFDWVIDKVTFVGGVCICMVFFVALYFGLHLWFWRNTPIEKI